MDIDYQAAQTECLTILDWLRWGTTHFNAAGLFFGHGTDNAWDEALSLVLGALHLPPTVKPEILAARLTAPERERLAYWFKRRIEERIPAAYLTGKAYFAGLTFHVDERVLVPRSPLAEIIEQQFSPWQDPDAIERVLDLCTGSGCIAIACADYLPAAQVDAVDISVDALAVAQQNVAQYQFEDRVRLLQGDCFAPVAQQRYDVIISNPPYVDAADLAAMPAEFTHEPEIGLAAGEDGLTIVDTILAQAKQHLTAHGILIVEVGNSADALIEKYPHLPFTWLDFQRGGDGVFMLTAEQL